MPTLEPGQIIIIEGVDLVTFMQGDTLAKHVCMVAQDPTKLWTTGAYDFFFFGQVDAARYLKGKKYTLVESVEPLQPWQLEVMEVTNEKMKGMSYGLFAYPALYWREFWHGTIDYTGSEPAPGAVIQNPICSEAVGCAYWRAGIKIGEFAGKKDATGLIPRNILEEANRGVIIKKV